MDKGSVVFPRYIELKFTHTDCLVGLVHSMRWKFSDVPSSVRLKVVNTDGIKQPCDVTEMDAQQRPLVAFNCKPCTQVLQAPSQSQSRSAMMAISYVALTVMYTGGFEHAHARAAMDVRYCVPFEFHPRGTLLQCSKL